MSTLVEHDPSDSAVAALSKTSHANTESASAPPSGRRVLHVINGEHYSGAERVQDLLAARLPEFGFDVGFACVKPGRFARDRKTQSVPLVDVAMRSRWDMSAALRLRDQVRSGGYQLLHAHTVRSALVARLAARLANVPLVYHVHSPASRDTTFAWRNFVNRNVERFSLRGAERLIAVSTSLAEHMRREGFDRRKLRVVANGVPAPESIPDRRPPKDTWTLGMVALFRPRKGLETLLDAIGLLRESGEDVRLRAIGPFETPEYEKEIRRRVSELQLDDRIEWTGFTSDVSAELNRLDLFVLPSLFGEGLPMVVLESMAAGVPVVATRVEGVPEAIRDGRDGALAEPGDAYDLAHSIRRVLSGELDWTEIRASARRRHAEWFSDRRMAEGVAAIYRELLGD